MRARIWSVLLFGLIGAALLAALGVWQLQRAAWKGGVLNQIEQRIQAVPVDLPRNPDPEADRFLPVRASGRLTGDPVRVLTSREGRGAGYRIISTFETGDRRVLLERGFLSERRALPDTEPGPVEVEGNLHWPQEVDGFTPAPDLARNIWYARDVEAMAAYLQTEPLLIVLREMEPGDAAVEPMPVSTESIPNNHLGYAIQWFGLALVWLGMTAFLLWRITRRTV